MQTDSEINEAVARKLGWVGSDYPAKDKGWIKRFYKGPEGEKEYFLDAPPDYCHSIEAAWQAVASFLGDRRYLRSFELRKNNASSWYAIFTESYSVDAIADTAPMAICLSFLRVWEEVE